MNTKIELTLIILGFVAAVIVFLLGAYCLGLLVINEDHIYNINSMPLGIDKTSDHIDSILSNANGTEPEHYLDDADKSYYMVLSLMFIVFSGILFYQSISSYLKYRSRNLDELSPLSYYYE